MQTSINVTHDAANNITYFSFNVGNINNRFCHNIEGIVEPDFNNGYSATVINEMYEKDIKEKTFNDIETANYWARKQINEIISYYQNNFPQVN